MLEGIRVVDLSAPLGPDTIMWPGAPQPSAETLVTIADNGYFARLLHVFEHSGTHFDAPCHMVEHTAAVDEVPVESLVAPIRVIDISGDIGSDADGLLTVDQVKAHEAKHGAIPSGSAVFLRTGWEDRNTDEVAYAGAPGDGGAVASKFTQIYGLFSPGYGGAGGGGGVTVAATNGANGYRGSGGGGGGGSLNGFAAGSGGNGGNGYVAIKAIFNS